MKKSELNQNIHLSEGNIKSKCTDDVMFLTWSLPSRKCCPYATNECKKRCFAKKNETFASVRLSREKNLEETKKETFVQDMINHLEYHLQRPKSKDKRIFVRIHTSGDFYNLDYFIKWVYIAEHFKGNDRILFQAYTKSMPIINAYTDEYCRVYGDGFSPKEIIEDINIRFVWSIWYDTPIEYTGSALDLQLQTFTALPKDEIQLAVNKGAFLCNGDCGNCKECYTGDSLKIVIPYH